MPDRLTRAICTAVLFFATAPGMSVAQSETVPDYASRETVGDWVVECLEGAEPAPGSCQLYQRVLTQDPNVAAMIAALAWSTDEDVVRLQVSLPLGADLQSNALLRVNGAEIESFAWSRCLASGCLIEAPLTPAVVVQMMLGETASITVVQPDAGGIEIPLSLNGFNPGMVRIMPEGILPDELIANGN